MRFRERQQLAMLERARAAHKFIMENPGCSKAAIGAHLGIGNSSTGHVVLSLEASGHIETALGARSPNGHLPNQYRAIKKEPPSELPESKAARARRLAEEGEDEKSIRRVFVKARQEGIARDPMIAAFYGPAGAQVQA